MGKDFATSDFVVLFTGEGAWTTLKNGWEEARSFALSQFIEDGEDEFREEVIRQTENPDYWLYSEGGNTIDDRLVFGPIEVGEITSLKLIRIMD